MNSSKIVLWINAANPDHHLYNMNAGQYVTEFMTKIDIYTGGDSVSWSYDDPHSSEVSHVIFGGKPKQYQYTAELFKNEAGKWIYKVGERAIEITEKEQEAVMHNPRLYYFSTALKLHARLGLGNDNKPVK